MCKTVPSSVDERRRDARLAEARSRGRVADDDGVAHERADERLVLRREAQRVGEPAHDPSSAGRPRCAPATNAGWSGTMVARPSPSSRQLVEQLDAALDVVHDDVLQARPEEPGERLRELRPEPRRDRPRGPRAPRRAFRSSAFVPAPTPSSRACISSSAARRERFLESSLLRLVERALLLTG